MADVFVSYASEDRERVRPLVAILEDAGFSVWWDRALEPGTRWAEVIDGELRRARCVVVVWSAAAARSRWVGIEANEARRRDILVPVALEPVSLGGEFSLIHRLDWFERTPDDAARTLVARVRDVRRRSRRRGRLPLVAAAVVATILAGAVLLWNPTAPAELGADAPAALAEAEPDAASVAVLAFRTTGADRTQPVLGDGIALELIDALAGVEDLRVAGRLAAWSLPAGLEMAEIRRRLGVAWLVEGDVDASADPGIRVRMRLVDSATGLVRDSWELFADPSDLMALRRQMVQRIVGALPGRSALPAGDGDDLAVPGEAYRLQLLGRAMLRDERSVESRVRAESYFQRALQIAPAYAEALAGLCEARLWRYDLTNDAADLDQAATQCASAEAAAADDPRVLRALGRLAVVRGEPDSAAEVFRRVLAADPFDTEARLGLAEAYSVLGDGDAADREFTRAIADQPGYWKLHNVYANFLLRQGRAEEAVRAYIAALDLVPDEPNALSNLGAALLMSDELPGAIRAFRRSLALGETTAAMSNLGTAYYYAQRLPEAAEVFERATALTPTDYRLWGNLADAWAILGDPRAADAYARAEALARENLSSVDDDAAIRIGIEAFRAARGEATVDSIDAALAGRTPTWETEYLAAVALSRVGEPARAGRSLDEAIARGLPETLASRDPLLAELVTAPVSGAVTTTEGPSP
ncbi:MAG TPA: TIR domain-containing protein [Pseudomonadales bacterium]|nr:TIR domain-containing protein [Pseudomonadales bacterium]